MAILVIYGKWFLLCFGGNQYRRSSVHSLQKQTRFFFTFGKG